MRSRRPLPADLPTDLGDARVLIFGLGRFGGGVGAARFFGERGARVVVTDLRRAEDLAPSLEALADVPIHEWVLGEHRPHDFEQNHWIVVNPGVPPHSRELRLAEAAGARFLTEIGLFLRWCPTPHVAGVTGSNGKSTTVRLVQQMLERSGRRSLLGGNIGVSLLGELTALGPDDRVVLELSSFQLSRLEPATPRPAVVAVTGFSANHLDWHGTVERYLEAKERILLPPAAGPGSAVLPGASPHLSRWRERTRREVLPFVTGEPSRPGVGYRGGDLVLETEGDSYRIVPMDEMALSGATNRSNAAAAVGVAHRLGASPSAMAEVLRRYRAAPHRQEVVATTDGITFVNDSKATTPEATLCVLEAFGPHAILILGGSSKGTDFTALARASSSSTRAVALLGETAPEIESALRAAGYPPEALFRAEGLADAFRWAVSRAESGDKVILSPACASFDQYLNYEERGNHFRAEVEAWRRQRA